MFSVPYSHQERVLRRIRLSVMAQRLAVPGSSLSDSSDIVGAYREEGRSSRFCNEDIQLVMSSVEWTTS
jgi:hypothetical protein